MGKPSSAQRAVVLFDMELCDHHDHDPTASGHAVLADVYIFHHVVSFQRGIPGRIVHLHRKYPERMNQPGILIKLAIEQNDLRAVQNILQILVDFPWYRPLRFMDLTDAMHDAAKLGRLNLLEWFHANTELECQPWTFAAAARCGQLDVLQWLHIHRPESKAKFKPFSMDRVAEEGRVQVFQWLETNLGVPCTTSALDSAAMNGHLEMIQYLHSHRPEGGTPLAMDMAALKGHLHILQFLHDNRSEGCTTWAMDAAASYGHLDIVQFLHTNRQEGCTVKALNEAAARGDMEMVQFLLTNRPEGGNKYAIRGAARQGKLEMVQFLHERFHKKYCTRDTMVAAAEEGQLEVVQYLDAHCDASSGLAIASAAANGHFQIVQYLVENRKDGCLVVARDKATKNKYHAIAAYLNDKILPGSDQCVSTNHDRNDKKRVCEKQPNESQ